MEVMFLEEEEEGEEEEEEEQGDEENVLTSKDRGLWVFGCNAVQNPARI